MGILLRQTDERSQYQERLAAELRERAKQRASGTGPLDQTKQSNYIKNTDGTSERIWLWLVAVAVLVIGSVIFIITR